MPKLNPMFMVTDHYGLLYGQDFYNKKYYHYIWRVDNHKPRYLVGGAEDFKEAKRICKYLELLNFDPEWS